MAENKNNKVIHKRSVQKGVVPTGTTLEFGELAVNYNSSEPFLSVRTTTGNTNSTTYAKFIDETAIDNKLSKKSDTGHTHSSYVNQNAFSYIAVSGQNTVEADTAKDTLTLAAGDNISITTDKTNDKVTIGVTGLSKDGHTHDDRYYTESEVDAKLSAKSNTGHTHDDRYYTESEVDAKIKGVSDDLANRYGFGNVKVGDVTVAADANVDTLTLVAGTNVQITPDKTNDQLTISADHNHDSVYSKTGHTHSVTLSGDVTGSANIDGTITTTVANDSHTHKSSNISDSISASSAITSGATGLVQGKAVYSYAATKSHSHGTVKLEGDVTGSATFGNGGATITTVVADNSHNHTSSNISDRITASTGIVDGATGLVDGNAVYDYAQPKGNYSVEGHKHTITLSGDVTGSGDITGTITTTVVNDSHTHGTSTITGTISADSGITSSATGLVQGKALTTIKSNADYGKTAHGWGNHASAGYYKAQDATTSTKGIVQLSDSVTSSASTKAATEKAVKDAYDLAKSKWKYDEATIKAVKVSNATYADSAGTAVDKTARDAASTAQSTADSKWKAQDATTSAKGIVKLKEGDLNTVTATTAGVAASSYHTHSQYTNQNAFSNVAVGDTTIAAETTTDTLNLVGGNNISITANADNDTVTIAATGLSKEGHTHSSYVNQNAFSYIAVSGQNTVEADTAKDTLTLAAGDNISITTDKTNDKVTIGVTGLSKDGHTHTISATATDDDIVILSGTNGTDGVIYDAKHKTYLSSAFASGAADKTISGSAASGSFKVPDIAVDVYGHVTGATDRTISITMPTIPTALKNPNSLTIQTNGTTLVTYDGSEAKTANITVPTKLSDLSNDLADLTVGTKKYDGSSAVTITASDLGLGSALKYCGITTTALTDGSTATTVTINGASHKAEAGCVVFYSDKEFVFNGTNWELLGAEATYKVVQDAVSSPSSANGSTIAFIDTISQDANGKITATKKNVRSATTGQTGVVKLVTGDMNGKAHADGKAPSLNHTHSQYQPKGDYSVEGHKHTITLSGDVTGSGDITGTITTTVANDSHTHKSSNISDSISASSAITSGATGLVQGKAVYSYAATKSHSHGTVKLEGDVTGSADFGNGGATITTTVANNSHTHKSSNISDRITASTGIVDGATGLVDGNAVYDYAATKGHEHDSVYSKTGHTHTQYLGSGATAADSSKLGGVAAANYLQKSGGTIEGDLELSGMTIFEHMVFLNDNVFFEKDYLYYGEDESVKFNFSTVNTYGSKAGASNSSNKLYLIGAGSQGSSVTTYSNASVYMQAGKLYVGDAEVATMTGINNAVSALTSGMAGFDGRLTDIETNGAKIKAAYNYNDKLYLFGVKELDKISSTYYGSNSPAYLQSNNLHLTGTLYLDGNSTIYWKDSDYGSGTTNLSYLENAHRRVGSEQSDTAKLYLIGTEEQGRSEMSYSRDCLYIEEEELFTPFLTVTDMLTLGKDGVYLEDKDEHIYLADVKSSASTALSTANSKWTYNEDTIKGVKVNNASTADTATNANKLGGVAASGYLKTGATAADSSKLGGVAASGYLKTGATAADSNKLGGVPASGYLQTGATAAAAQKFMNNAYTIGDLNAAENIHGYYNGNSANRPESAGTVVGFKNTQCMLQLASGYKPSHDMYYRTWHATQGWSAWKTIIDSENWSEFITVSGGGVADGNNYLTGVSGSGNGTVTFTRSGLNNLTWDASHTHAGYQPLITNYIELGSPGANQTSYIDFHYNHADFDARLECRGNRDLRVYSNLLPESTASTSNGTLGSASRRWNGLFTTAANIAGTLRFYGGNYAANLNMDGSSLALDTELKITAGGWTAGMSDISPNIACAMKAERFQARNLFAENVILGGDSTNKSTKALNFVKYTSVSSTAPSGLTTLMSLSTSGNLTISGGTVSGATAYYQTSDERLKTFGDDIEVDFDKLKSIPKKYFTWNDGENKELQIGTSAQKVKELYPELIGYDVETDKYSVDYAKLSVVALKAVDKLHEENEMLKSMLAKMDERLSKLENNN